MTSAPSDILRFFRDSRPLLDLYRDLLIECKETSKRFSTWAGLDGSAESRMERFVPAVTAILKSESWLTRGTSPSWESIQACTRVGERESLPHFATLRGIVRAIGEIAEKQLTHLFIARMRETGGRIEKGNLLHTPKGLNLCQIFGDKASFSPKPSRIRLSTPDNPTPDFRLADSEYFDRFDVFLDFRNSDAVDDLYEKSLHRGIAIGDPGLIFPRDFRLVEQWDGTHPPDTNCFGIYPANEDQLERIGAILEFAMNTSVGVVVLPELVASPDMVLQIAASVQKHASRSGLVIAGSFHDLISRQHELLGWWILPPTIRRISHRKYHPGRAGKLKEFLGPRDGSGVITPPSITVHCGFSGLRIATLICADALGPEIEEILCCLGVNLVLTPATSESTGVFNGIAAKLADTTQGITVVANTPHREEDPSAMVRLPLRDGREFWMGRAYQDPPPRILLKDKTMTHWRILKNGQEVAGDSTSRDVPGVCFFFWPNFHCEWREIKKP